jgi:adenine-specific DNA methylase
MIPKECKRLAEVDFPIAVVSKHSAREKEARIGHIPKIHIWPAARPRGACRAILMGLLLPDPCDHHCPEDFKKKARQLLPKVQGMVGPKDEDLQKALFKFIADFSNWDLSTDRTYLEISRGLVKAAYFKEPPYIVDPFAGGGAIPLEALRLGCEVFAADLNPVACLILKSILDNIPRHKTKLSEELQKIGVKVHEQALKELGRFYPLDYGNNLPIAYIWARTVRCESPNCGAEIPLARSFWLTRKSKRKLAVRYKIERIKEKTPQLKFEIFEVKSEGEVSRGTISRANATCPCCNTVLPASRVRVQLVTQRGGAEVLFDDQGKRIGGATLLAVVTIKEGVTGRQYRPPTDQDYLAVYTAQQAFEKLPENLIPNEILPLMSGTFNAPIYGITTWGDLFTKRQKLTLIKFIQIINKTEMSDSCREIFALCFDKMIDMNTALCIWQTHAQIPAHTLSRYAIPMSWDFAEAVPIAGASGSLISSLKRTIDCFPSIELIEPNASIQLADANVSPLPDESTDVWFTDPPYYNAVPYADLSDFFFVWLKRTLPHHPLLFDPFDMKNPLTPKDQELCEMSGWDPIRYSHKGKKFYEDGMFHAFAEGRRILSSEGVGCVVFAHKTTEGWEALLSGMIRGGWTITGSWPIATEMGSRLRARESAALATSVHLVCRPRADNAPVGDWGEVLRELPKRVGDWMERLQSEGIRGADLVFACIGPALEIYSRYSKVVDAEEREIPLGGDPEALEPHRKGFLAYVWEVVGRTALEHVLGTAEARARNSTAGALEEDARLTALFLWTLQSTNGNGVREKKENDEETEEDEEDTGKDAGATKKKKGYSLIFDVVRRFAQPLGIHLPEWEGRIIETEKGVVRLLSVKERAKQLFGEESAQTFADRFERSPEISLQLKLFPERDKGAAPEIKGHKGRKKKAVGAVSDEALRAKQEATTLDRIHAAMLLQSSGRTNALRALLKSEQDRGPDFLRLANSLSALYPKQSEEKRLLDAMLLAIPR